MAKKITKKDPNEEISEFLKYKSIKKNSKDTKKVSASLKRLQAERKRSLRRNLGLILSISTIAFLGLGYYISPQADVKVVRIIGANDINGVELVHRAEIKTSDKVVSYFLKSPKITKKVNEEYPEVKKVNFNCGKVNQLTMDITEFSTIGYLKDGDNYHKILSNGNIGHQKLQWNQVSQKYPLFLSFTKKYQLNQDIKVFKSLPNDIKAQIKIINGNTARPTQIILVMHDGNVIIGNIDTLKDKIQYYAKIKNNLTKASLVDLEIGGFSRSLTSEENKAYNIK